MSGPSSPSRTARSRRVTSPPRAPRGSPWGRRARWSCWTPSWSAWSRSAPTLGWDQRTPHRPTGIRGSVPGTCSSCSGRSAYRRGGRPMRSPVERSCATGPGWRSRRGRGATHPPSSRPSGWVLAAYHSQAQRRRAPDAPCPLRSGTPNGYRRTEGLLVTSWPLYRKGSGCGDDDDLGPPGVGAWCCHASVWAFGTLEPGKTPTGIGMGVRQRQTRFMRTLTVTVCQLDNRAQHRPEALPALRRHVVERGSELLVLPELPFSDWLAADPVSDAARWQHSVEAHRVAVDRLQELGVRAVVASRPTVEVTGSRRNQAFLWTLEAGAARVRDKRYLPDEPGYWEASWYDRGDPEFPTVCVADARIGILVCTDLWFFEWARHYARSGVDLLCLPRATPHDSLARWLAGGQVAATCSGAYCLSSNQWNPSGAGIDCGGLGWVVDPDGNVLATTSAEEPFVTVKVDLDITRQAKNTYPRYVRE